MEIEKHFQIGYSSNDLVRIYNKRLYMEIEDAIIHPGFNLVPTESGTGRAINDIALIKLKSPLKFSSTVQPACLGIEHQELYDGIMKVAVFAFSKFLFGFYTGKFPAKNFEVI